MPDAVGFAAFNDLEGSGVVEGRVGGFEPFADVGRDHDLGGGVKELIVYLGHLSH